jgi:hypothetical protein
MSSAPTTLSNPALPVGHILADRYSIQQHLSGMGDRLTYLACDRHRPGHPTCLVKQALGQGSQRQSLLQTAQALEQTGIQRQLPQLIACFEQGPSLYMVEEWVTGTPLADCIQGKPATDQHLLDFCRDALTALQALHHQSLGLTHWHPQAWIHCDRYHTWRCIDLSHCQPQGTSVLRQDLVSLGHLAAQWLAGSSTPRVKRSPDHPAIAAILAQLLDPAQGYPSATEALEALHNLTGQHPLRGPQSPQLAPLTLPPLDPDLSFGAIPSSEEHSDRHRAIWLGLATGAVTAAACAGAISYLPEGTGEKLANRSTLSTLVDILPPVDPSPSLAASDRPPAEQRLAATPLPPPTPASHMRPAAIAPIGTPGAPPPRPATAAPTAPRPSEAPSAATPPAINAATPSTPSTPTQRDRPAVPLHEQAVAILQRNFGTDPAQLMSRLQTLGDTYTHDKNYSAAYFIYQTIAKLQAQHPDIHPEHQPTVQQRLAFLSQTLDRQDIPVQPSLRPSPRDRPTIQPAPKPDRFTAHLTPEPKTDATHPHVATHPNRHTPPQSTADSDHPTQRLDDPGHGNHHAIDSTPDVADSAAVDQGEYALSPDQGLHESLEATLNPLSNEPLDVQGDRPLDLSPDLSPDLPPDMSPDLSPDSQSDSQSDSQPGNQSDRLPEIPAWEAETQPETASPSSDLPDPLDESISLDPIPDSVDNPLPPGIAPLESEQADPTEVYDAIPQSVALQSVLLSTFATPDGRYLIQVYADSSIQVIDAETHTPYVYLASVPHDIIAVAVQPDQQILIIQSSDRSESYWNLQTGDRLTEIVSSLNV